jgi:hypothetical protein
MRPVHGWRVIGAIHCQTDLLPVVADEEREHEQVCQNDAYNCRHVDVPVSASVTQLLVME